MKSTKQVLFWLMVGFLAIFLLTTIIMVCQPSGWVRFFSVLPIIGIGGCSFVIGMYYNEYKYLKNKEAQKK